MVNIGRIRSRPVEPRPMPGLERVRSEGWISVKERLPEKNAGEAGRGLK